MAFLLQETLLAVVVVIIPLLLGVAGSSQHHNVCDNESRVKLSVLYALRQNYALKELRIKEFERQVEALARSQTHLNTAHTEAEELQAKIDNMTTSELQELETLQTCSVDGFLDDCCQVT